MSEMVHGSCHVLYCMRVLILCLFAKWVCRHLNWVLSVLQFSRFEDFFPWRVASFSFRSAIYWLWENFSWGVSCRHIQPVVQWIIQPSWLTYFPVFCLLLCLLQLALRNSTYLVCFVFMWRLSVRIQSDIFVWYDRDFYSPRFQCVCHIKLFGACVDKMFVLL